MVTKLIRLSMNKRIFCILSFISFAPWSMACNKNNSYPKYTFDSKAYPQLITAAHANRNAYDSALKKMNETETRFNQTSSDLAANPKDTNCKNALKKAYNDYQREAYPNFLTARDTYLQGESLAYKKQKDEIIELTTYLYQLNGFSMKAWRGGSQRTKVHYTKKWEHHIKKHRHQLRATPTSVQIPAPIDFTPSQTCSEWDEIYRKFITANNRLDRSIHGLNKSIDLLNQAERAKNLYINIFKTATTNARQEYDKAKLNYDTIYATREELRKTILKESGHRLKPTAFL